jgi:hypothetical protein
VLLIAVPIAFNVAFFQLGRAFDYPNILRREPDEILRRFAAGGSGLILRWEGTAPECAGDAAPGGAALRRAWRPASADRRFSRRGRRSGLVQVLGL